MSKTIAIIPARGGSKRLPQKNIKLLGNIPLIAHSILYAKEHNFISDVYVSTDDESIKKIALELFMFFIISSICSLFSSRKK